MGFSFNTITTGIRTNTHHTEVDASRALSGLSPELPNVILVMGLGRASGTVAELTLKQVLSHSQSEGYWGIDSQIADMIRIAKLNNPTAEMYGISIDPAGGGTAGTTTLTFTGTTTAAGTLHMYIGGQYIPIAIPTGTAAAAVATACNTQLQASTRYSRLAFTSGAATTVVTLTMKWAGVEQPDVRFNYSEGEGFPAGITCAVAEGVAGAGNPDVSEIIAVLPETHYTTWITGWNDGTNLGLVDTELERRFGGMVQREGVCFSAICDTHTNTTTAGNAENSKHIVYMGGNQALSPSWQWAAGCGAVDAGEPDPARPRQTLRVLGLVPAASSATWTRAERDLLLHDGIATHTVDAAGNVYIERHITTYQTNPQSVADPTWLDVTTHRTLDALRYSRRTQVALDFPRHKAMGPASSQDAEVAVPLGQPIVTVHVLRNHGLAQFKQWQAKGWVEDFEQFADEYIVLRDPNDQNRFQEQMGPNLVNQFRGLSNQMQFLLA